mmetsp:Transcript_24559/g.53561  ORF Transcript_24559/g.53561 Transcript_24559/m.53561 type:complete len:84 (+) Transcript_24559:1078-1329(+)
MVDCSLCPALQTVHLCNSWSLPKRRALWILPRSRPSALQSTEQERKAAQRSEKAGDGTNSITTWPFQLTQLTFDRRVEQRFDI